MMKKYKLSDLFDLQMGKTPARNNPKYWEEGTNPWISIADMSSNGKYITTTKECITDRAISDTGIRPILPDTVIMSFKLSIGKVARTMVKSYSNEAIMAFEIKDREPSQYTIDNDYAYYLLSALNFENIGNKAVMGKTLNKAILENTEVYVHPRDEQRRIISKLDKVIELIELRTQQLSKLDELVKSRFIELFGDVASCPKYDGVTLGTICTTISGGTPTTKVPEYYEGDIPWISTPYLGNNHINGSSAKAYITDEAVKNSATHLIPANTIMFGIRVGVGKSSIIDEPMCANQDIVALMGIDTNKYNLLFLKHVLDGYQSHFDSIKKGATILGITTEDLKKVLVPAVDIEIQNQFATFVEQTDKSKLAIQQSLEKLETLKKALMQKYFG